MPIKILFWIFHTYTVNLCPMKIKLHTILLLVSFYIYFPTSLFAQMVDLKVPYYEQGKDSPWADEILGNKSEFTIRTHGCALTCISMITSHFSEKKITPSDMNRWLKKNNGFHDAWEGESYLGEVKLNWPAVSGFSKGYVYTRHDWKAKPADLILIQYYLDKGKPVIGEVVYKNAPHYIIITGYDENGFIMNDPEFPEQHHFNSIYNVSDKWGSGASRNIYGIRVLYPAE
jgi:uncharacterized protein YvpB